MALGVDYIARVSGFESVYKVCDVYSIYLFINSMGYGILLIKIAICIDNAYTWNEKATYSRDGIDA